MDKRIVNAGDGEKRDRRSARDGAPDVARAMWCWVAATVLLEVGARARCMHVTLAREDSLNIRYSDRQTVM